MAAVARRRKMEYMIAVEGCSLLCCAHFSLKIAVGASCGTETNGRCNNLTVTVRRRRMTENQRVGRIYCVTASDLQTARELCSSGRSIIGRPPRPLLVPLLVQAPDDLAPSFPSSSCSDFFQPSRIFLHNCKHSIISTPASPLACAAS